MINKRCFVLFVVSYLCAESGSALQCVKCTSNPGQETPGCDDPFDASLITTTDTCGGRCLVCIVQSVCIKNIIHKVQTGSSIL